MWIVHFSTFLHLLKAKQLALLQAVAIPLLVDVNSCFATMKNVVLLFHDLSTLKLKAYFKLEYKHLVVQLQYFKSSKKHVGQGDLGMSRKKSFAKITSGSCNSNKKYQLSNIVYLQKAWNDEKSHKKEFCFYIPNCLIVISTFR